MSVAFDSTNVFSISSSPSVQQASIQAVNDAFAWLQELSIHTDGTRDSFSVLRSLIQNAPEDPHARKILEPVLRILQNMDQSNDFFHPDLKQSCLSAAEAFAQEYSAATESSHTEGK